MISRILGIHTTCNDWRTRGSDKNTNRRNVADASNHGVKWNFDSSGNLTSIQDPHNLAITFTYSGSLLSTIQRPDGSRTTFNYTSGLLSSIIEPGPRTMTLSHTGSDLTGVTEVDGSLVTMTYDGQHHLPNEQWGPLNLTFTYDSNYGYVSGVQGAGPGPGVQVQPASVRSLNTTNASQPSDIVSVLTDGLNRVTTATLDMRGYLTSCRRPTGARRPGRETIWSKSPPTSTRSVGLRRWPTTAAI